MLQDSLREHNTKINMIEKLRAKIAGDISTAQGDIEKANAMASAFGKKQQQYDLVCGSFITFSKKKIIYIFPLFAGNCGIPEEMRRLGLGAGRVST